MLIDVEDLAGKMARKLSEDIEVQGLAPINYILETNAQADSEFGKVLSAVIRQIYQTGHACGIQAPALQKALQQDIADSVREDVTADVSDELEKLYAS